MSSDPDGPSPAHLTPDEFRALGHRTIDWIADYMATVGDRPVLSTVEPGVVRDGLPDEPPEAPESFDDVLADLDRVIMPGITHWQSPGFFGYFPANASGPAILGDLVSAGLGVQGMMWSTSPACTELEQVVLDWLVRAAGLPESFLSDGPGGGVIQDSASSASLCALVAARERAGGNDRLDRLVAYMSSETHSSLEKGARVAGLRAEHLRVVPTDGEQRMDVEELAALVAADRAAGLIPFFVCATAGSTSTTAFDPTEAICDVAEANDLWVHLDAAYAGSAAVCPEFRWVIAGIDRVDSYCFNPHKWLLTNFDCSAFWLRDRSALLAALSILPEYLRNETSASGAVVDYRNWQVPMGRRFRALKLWFVVRHYGIAGLQAHIRTHVAWAEWLADQVEAHPSLEPAAPRTLSLVCLRHLDGDERTRHMLHEVNRSGRAFVTHTVVDGRYVLRVAIGGTATTWPDVQRLWDQLRALADD